MGEPRANSDAKVRRSIDETVKALTASNLSSTCYHKIRRLHDDKISNKGIASEVCMMHACSSCARGEAAARHSGQVQMHKGKKYGSLSTVYSYGYTGVQYEPRIFPLMCWDLF